MIRVVPTSWFWRRVVLAVVVGLVIRVVYIAWLHRVGTFLIGDARVFHNEGHVIADGRGWIDPFFFETTGFTRQLSMHPPSYPVYLAFWSLIGLRSVLSHQLVSQPIGLTTIVLCAIAGRRLWNERVGVVAACIVAVHPSFWSWDGMVLQEPLAILATVLLILAYLPLLPRRLGGSAADSGRPFTRRQVVLAGLASGFAPLVRAELLAGVVMLALVVLFANTWRRSLVPMLGAAVIAVACLTPWVSYNMSRFSQTSTLSNGFGITLSSTHCDLLDGDLLGYWSPVCASQAAERIANAWFAEHPDTPQLPMAATQAEYVAARARGEKILAPSQAILRFSALDESERDALLRDETIAWIKAHPRYELRAIPARLGRVLGLYRPLQQIGLDTIPDGRKRPIAVSAWLGYYAVLPFAVAGALALWRRRRAQTLILLIPLATVLITVAMTFGNTRYRAIAEPTFALFGAAAMVSVASWVARVWRERPLEHLDSPA